MISEYVLNTGGASAVGYGLGWLLASTSNASTHAGGLVGAISGLADRLLNAGLFLVVKEHSMADDKIYLIKAAVQTTVAVVTLVALARIGISPTGLVLTGFLFTLHVCTSLDRAISQWDKKTTVLINSNDVNMMFK